jgi:hypothetical protein
MQQQQVVPVAVDEEGGDAAPNRTLVGIHQQLGLEPADGWVAEHLDQRVGVVPGRAQLRQRRVVVAGVRDDQRASGTRVGAGRQRQQRLDDAAYLGVAGRGQVDVDAGHRDLDRLVAFGVPGRAPTDRLYDAGQRLTGLHRGNDELAYGEQLHRPGTVGCHTGGHLVDPRDVEVGQLGAQRQRELLDRIRATQVTFDGRDTQWKVKSRCRGHRYLTP